MESNVFRVIRLVLLAVSPLAVFCISCSEPESPPVVSNNPPVVSSLQSQESWVELSGSSEVDCIASDPDGDELTYVWRATGGSISGHGSNITWIAPSTQGIYTVTVIVLDDRGGEATTQVPMLVLVNDPPVIESLNTERRGCVPTQSSAIECIASDPEGDELTYAWTATGGEISGQGTAITWTAPEAFGTYTITVTVTDDRGGERSDALDIGVGSP